MATLSVTFGISMYIFMNSFMTGVNDVQTELAFSTLAHVHIYNDIPADNTNLLAGYLPNNPAVHVRNAKVIRYTEGIRNSAKIMHTVQQLPQVAGVAPQVNLNVFFRNGATERNGQLSGIDVATEDALFKTSDYVVAGNWYDMQHRSDGIIMGSGLAQRLSLNLNDVVVVTTADGISRNYKIIGLVTTTLGQVDNGKAYIRINAARQLISKNQGYVTDIQVNLNDYNEAPQVSEALAPAVPYKVEAWQAANGQLEAGSQLRNIIAIAVSFTILLVAGFGIYNIMNMTVNEKIKEIAILKAMGFEGGDIVQIFLIQSVLIGVLGGLVGMAFGYGVAVGVNHLPFEIAMLETLPMAYRTADYVLAFVFGLLTTFIAGYLPAKKASMVDPVEIIRG